MIIDLFKDEALEKIVALTLLEDLKNLEHDCALYEKRGIRSKQAKKDIKAIKRVLNYYGVETD